MDINYKKQATLLLSCVNNILLKQENLEYDTPEDAKVVIESRQNLFTELFAILTQNYAQNEDVEMEIEEKKVDESHVVQEDIKNSDIRSVKKEVIEFHQLIVEALAFSNTPEFISQQFELYKIMYFSVSREIRLGILNNLNTLFGTI